ncbi:MAG: hypothetical protein J0H39_21370 [Alphaproteobacteria bacterium]|nr:hypothetical protein [Alphaproteobacteria bacterium]
MGQRRHLTTLGLRPLPPAIARRTRPDRAANATTTAQYNKVADGAKREAVESMQGTIDAAGPGKFAMESPTAQSHRINLRRVK